MTHDQAGCMRCEGRGWRVLADGSGGVCSGCMGRPTWGHEAYADDFRLRKTATLLAETAKQIRRLSLSRVRASTALRLFNRLAQVLPDAFQ